MASHSASGSTSAQFGMSTGRGEGIRAATTNRFSGYRFMN